MEAIQQIEGEVIESMRALIALLDYSREDLIALVDDAIERETNE